MIVDDVDAKRIQARKRRLVSLTLVALACLLLTVFGFAASAVFANSATKLFYDKNCRLAKARQDILRQYSILSRESPFESTAPKNWTFQGSNDGVSWTTLDSQTGIIFKAIENKIFTFRNNTAYRYFMLDVTRNGGNANWLSITELEIFQIDSQDACPIMTSNTTPRPYACSSSSEANVAFAAYKAFDHSGGTAWATATGVTTGSLEIDFGGRGLDGLAEGQIYTSTKIPWASGLQVFNSAYDPPAGLRNQGIANVCGVLGILGLIATVVCFIIIWLARKKSGERGESQLVSLETTRGSASEPVAEEGCAIGALWNYLKKGLNACKQAFVSPETAFIVIGLVFGILMLLMNPPFRAADENAHFARAYSISEGHLVSKITPSQNYTDRIPESFGLLWERTKFWPREPKSVKLSDITSSLNIPLGSRHVSPADFSPWGSSVVSPISYLPQVLGISIGRIFHLSPLMLMYLGRLACLLFFLFLVFIAIVLTPVLKWTFVLLGLMPLTINLAASLSYDSFLIALSFLFIAYLLFLALDKRRQQITRKDLYILLALAALLALVKPPYFLLVVLYLAIPRNRLKSKKEYYAVFALLLVLVIIIAGAWVLVSGKQNPATALPSEARGVVTNPLRFPTVLLKTVNLYKKSWLENFVGSLGWAEVQLPIWFTFIYIFLVIAVTALDKSDITVRARQKAIALATLLLVFVAIFAIFYLSIAPGATTLGGIHPRYFIPVAPFLFLLFYNTAIRYEKGKYFYFTVIGFTVFSIVLTMLKLVSFYYV